MNPGRRPDIHQLVELLQRNSMMSRAEATRTLGHPVTPWDWKIAHITYYNRIGRSDLAAIVRQ